MAIRINGTTVATNRINGTSISSETLNGAQVYGGTSKVWYWYGQETSEPSVNTAYTRIISQLTWPTRSELEDMMTGWFPPANLPVGTIGWIGSTNYDDYFLLMVIEE